MGEHTNNTNNTPTLQLNISTAFIDKQPIADLEKRYCKAHDCKDTCWAFGSTFNPATLTPAQLVEHIRQGRAFTLGYFNSNRRTKATFISSQLLALDLDNCPLDTDQIANDPFIRQYAYLIYRTPSYTPETPKHRVLFVLDQPIEGKHAVTRWEAMQKGLIRHMAHLNPDVACKDAARLFYGSTQPGGWHNG